MESIMAANGISTLANKKLRQEAKLALAGQDRADRNLVEPGRYSDTSADISQLPTKYKADNTLENNANTGGLLAGRPWA
jgi:hypothetical protein